MATEPIILPQTTPKEKTVEVPANFGGQREAQSNIALGEKMQKLGIDMSNAAQRRTARTDKIHLNNMEDAAEIEFGSMFEERIRSGSFLDDGSLKSFDEELNASGQRMMQNFPGSKNALAELMQRIKRQGTKVKDLAMQHSIKEADAAVKLGYTKSIHKFHVTHSKLAAEGGVTKEHDNGLDDTYVDSMISAYETEVLNRHASGADTMTEMWAEDAGRALIMNDGFEAIMSSSFLKDRRAKARRFVNETPQFFGYAEEMRMELNRRLDTLDRKDEENKEGDKFGDFRVPIVDEKGKPTGKFRNQWMTNRKAARRGLGKASDKDAKLSDAEQKEGLVAWFVTQGGKRSPELAKQMLGLKPEAVSDVKARITELKAMLDREAITTDEFNKMSLEIITKFKEAQTIKEKGAELQEFALANNLTLTNDQLLGFLKIPIHEKNRKEINEKLNAQRKIVEDAGGFFGLPQANAALGIEPKLYAVSSDIALVDSLGKMVRLPTNLDEQMVAKKALYIALGDAKADVAKANLYKSLGYKDPTAKSKLVDDRGSPTPEVTRLLQNSFDGLLGADKDQDGNSIGLSGKKGIFSAGLLKQAEKLIMDGDAFSVGDAFAQVAMTIDPKKLPESFTWTEIFDQLVDNAKLSLPDGGKIGSGEETLSYAVKIATEDASGFLSKLVDMWQNYPGQITGYSNQEVIEARWQLSLIARDFIRVFAMNPRFPIAEQIMLGGIFSGPNAFRNPDLVRLQMATLQAEVKGRLANIKIQLGATAVDPKRAGELITDVEALSTLDQRLDKFDLIGRKYDLKFHKMSLEEIEAAPIGKITTSLRNSTDAAVDKLSLEKRQLLGRRQRMERERQSGEIVR